MNLLNRLLLVSMTSTLASLKHGQMDKTPTFPWFNQPFPHRGFQESVHRCTMTSAIYGMVCNPTGFVTLSFISKTTLIRVPLWLAACSTKWVWSMISPIVSGYTLHYQWLFNGRVKSLVCLRNGFGVGDLQGGVYGLIYQNDTLRIGAKGNLYIPTSTNDAWLGETGPRLSALANLSPNWQDVDLALQMGPHFRSAINTDLDFVLGNEWVIDAGAKWNIWPNKVAITTSYHARHGLNNLFRGGAENSQEITQVSNGEKEITFGNWDWRKVLNDGYGASEFQAFLGYTIHRLPEEPIEEVIPQPTLKNPSSSKNRLSKKRNGNQKNSPR